jgi:hypothetical protein
MANKVVIKTVKDIAKNYTPKSGEVFLFDGTAYMKLESEAKCKMLGGGDRYMEVNCICLDDGRLVSFTFPDPDNDEDLTFFSSTTMTIEGVK